MRVMATTFDPNEPLPGHSRLNSDDSLKSKGFLKRFLNGKKDQRVQGEGKRRISDPTDDLSNRKKSGVNQRPDFFSEPSSSVRPLLQKPEPREEVFALIRKPPPASYPNSPAPPRRPSATSSFSIVSASSHASYVDSASLMEPLMDFDVVYEIANIVDKKWMEFVNNYAKVSRQVFKTRERRWTS